MRPVRLARCLSGRAAPGVLARCRSARALVATIGHPQSSREADEDLVQRAGSREARDPRARRSERRPKTIGHRPRDRAARVLALEGRAARRMAAHARRQADQAFAYFGGRSKSMRGHAVVEALDPARGSRCVLTRFLALPRREGRGVLARSGAGANPGRDSLAAEDRLDAACLALVELRAVHVAVVGGGRRFIPTGWRSRFALQLRPASVLGCTWMDRKLIMQSLLSYHTSAVASPAPIIRRHLENLFVTEPEAAREVTDWRARGNTQADALEGVLRHQPLAASGISVACWKPDDERWQSKTGACWRHRVDNPGRRRIAVAARRHDLDRPRVRGHLAFTLAPRPQQNAVNRRVKSTRLRHRSTGDEHGLATSAKTCQRPARSPPSCRTARTYRQLLRYNIVTSSTVNVGGSRRRTWRGAAIDGRFSALVQVKGLTDDAAQASTGNGSVFAAPFGGGPDSGSARRSRPPTTGPTGTTQVTSPLRVS